jgi:hypothetical protein
LPDWRELIAAQDSAAPLEARTYYGPASSSASAPHKFGCGDDGVYAMKFATMHTVTEERLCPSIWRAVVGRLWGRP